MHHFKNALRSKKSKVEFQHDKSAPEERPKAIPDQLPKPEVEVQYEALESDPSRVIAIQRSVSPAVIIKGITTAADVAKNVAEVVDMLQDSGVVDKIGDALDRLDEQKRPENKKSAKLSDAKDAFDVLDKVMDVVHDDGGIRPRSGAGDKTLLPPAVAAHNARMRVKASSALSQEPPKDGLGLAKHDEDKPIDLPTPLAKALKHMEIVAARSKPPATPQGLQALSNHMRAVAAEPGAVADGKHKEKDEPKLPPNLAKAMRAMQIVGARTPEGRALVAAAVVPPNERASSNTVSNPQIKIHAATGLDVEDATHGGSGDVKKVIDLPPELKAYQRHMEIFAASHKSIGSGPVSRVAHDQALQTEHDPGLSTGQAPIQTAKYATASTSEPSVVPPSDTDDASICEGIASVKPTTTIPTNQPGPTDKAVSAGVIEATLVEPAPMEPTPPLEITSAAQPKAVTNTTPVSKPSTSLAAKDTVPPTVNDILQYRYHHGVNLGSIYVLEKWITPSAFPPDAPEEESSELSCVSEWVKEIGLEATQKKFEQRWSNALSDEDWTWLTTKGSCTSIRLPIGHFTLGPEYCTGTPFEDFGAIYTNAWIAVREFIKAAHGHGVGILIDLHALPGGSNPGEYSGTNSGEAGLWESPSNLELASKCVVFVAEDVKELDGIVGIQLCNEAVLDAKGMYDWYIKTIAAVSAVDARVPLYISDAWNLQEAVKFSKGQNKVGKKQNPLVVDTHIYFCFDDEDKELDPAGIVRKLLNSLSATDSDKEANRGSILDHGASSVVVGEYCCALDPESWETQDGGDVDATKKAFGNTQGEYFSSQAGGAYFWTLKMDWIDGGDWDFVEQTKTSAILAPNWLCFSKEEVEGRTQNADSKAKSLKNDAIKAYEEAIISASREQASPKTGQDAKQDTKRFTKIQASKHTKQQIKQKATAQPIKPENSSFSSGWELGWNDARSFFRSRKDGKLAGDGADRIGFGELWVLKRLRQSGVPVDKLGEVEKGIWKGIKDFESVALD